MKYTSVKTIDLDYGFLTCTLGLNLTVLETVITDFNRIHYKPFEVLLEILLVNEQCLDGLIF